MGLTPCRVLLSGHSKQTVGTNDAQRILQTVPYILEFLRTTIS